MAFKIIRNDITKVSADAIVNTANFLPSVGNGIDAAIYEAAGKEELLAARREIGIIERGQCAWTPSFKLKSRKIKYIIHTSGTFYKNGKNKEEEILRNCYANSLKMAKELKCKSIAIPFLATGFYGFPKELALQIAIDEISKFLICDSQNDGIDESLEQLKVFLVVYDDESCRISEKYYDEIENFLSRNSKPARSKKKKREEINILYSDDESSMFDFVCERTVIQNERFESARSLHHDFDRVCSSVKKENFNKKDIEAYISKTSENMNFQNTLQKMIADRKLENSAVYSKAFIDRKFFSKIISTKDYIPKKQTVMALGLALELSADEFEELMTSAGYAFMPSSKFDLIIKFCVMKKIYNIVEIDILLNDHGLNCFAPN